MSDWTAGYVAEIDYTYGYYTELNPQRIELALIDQGIKPPKIENACELGFGQGLSINIHCAASNVKWWGTDFNPNQALFAKELANAYANGAQVTDQAFAEFCARDDLPEFDYIGLHGIWSWISDENRHVIVDFLRRKLKLGGLLYVSYNTLPGWAANMPLRHLMTEHAQMMGALGEPLTEKIEAALGFSGQVFASNAAFGRANPLVVDRLNKLKGQNPNYLAHEYFNRDWHPMYFRQMENWLGVAKLTFAGSASYLDHIEALNFLPEHRNLLAGISDSSFRETVRDYLVNQQFRKDYWVKGARRLSETERIMALRELKVILACQPSDLPMKVTGGQGEAELQEAVYKPILELLGTFHIYSVGQIEAKLADTLNLAQITQALLVMSGTGNLHFVRESSDLKSLKARTTALNRHLCERAKTNGEIVFLASPISAGGVAVSRFNQLFTLGVMAGKKTATDLGAYVWDILSSFGQKIIKEGTKLETHEENLAEMTQQAADFVEKRLPILKALQIV